MGLTRQKDHKYRINGTDNKNTKEEYFFNTKEGIEINQEAY